MELRAMPQSSTSSRRPGPIWTSRPSMDCQGSPLSALLSPVGLQDVSSGRHPRSVPPRVPKGSPLALRTALHCAAQNVLAPVWAVPRMGLRMFRASGGLKFLVSVLLHEGCALARAGGVVLLKARVRGDTRLEKYWCVVDTSSEQIDILFWKGGKQIHSEGRTEIVDILTKSGAKLDIQDKRGRSGGPQVRSTPSGTSRV